MHSRLRELPFHYGWVIVAVGALTLFACLGMARFAFGMLLPSMGQGLGLAYDQMGYIGTGNFAGYLLSVSLIPLAIRRYSPRRLIASGLLLIALCMLAIASSTSFAVVLWLYALIGCGSGMANIPTMVLISHWFHRRRRGRAAGLMIVGNGAAIIFSGMFVPALNRVMGAEGWRTAWVVLGGMTALIALVAAILLRNDPREVGLAPLGDSDPIAADQWVLGETSGSAPTLLLLGGLYFAFGTTYMVYGTFIVTTMVEEFSLAETTAGAFWSWVGFLAIFSSVGFGTLSDRIGRKGGLMVVFALQAIAYALVGCRLGLSALPLSIGLYGLTVFAVPTIMAAAVGDYLGLVRAASGFSLITVFFAIGQMLGPAAAGILAEAGGSFGPAYLAASFIVGIAAILAFFLPRLRTV